MALPGVTTVLKDRFYTISRTDVPPGPRVVVIATPDTPEGTTDTNDNPVVSYDPYNPRNEADCIAAFGEGSGCHRAYLEMLSGGAVRATIIALPDGTTDAMIAGAAGTEGENVIDRAFEAAETATPDIIVAWGRGGHPADWQDPATPEDDVPFGFHADNGTVATRVADWCKTITDRSHPCFAVMGLKPHVGTGADATESITAANLGPHLTFSSLPDRDAAGSNGQYLSVVAGELNPTAYPQHPTDRSKAGVFGYSNGAGLYAGYLAQLDPWQTSTGKQIFNVTGMRYNPTRTQQENLTYDGIVPVSLDYNRVPIWVDGVTWGKRTSDYARLSTLRITFAAVLGVRQVSQTFVGEPATLHTRNAFETAITAFLRGMTQIGALLDSDFTVSYVPRESKAIVDMVLRPAFELRNIEISIAVDL